MVWPSVFPLLEHSRGLHSLPTASNPHLRKLHKVHFAQQDLQQTRKTITELLRRTVHSSAVRAPRPHLRHQHLVGRGRLYGRNVPCGTCLASRHPTSRHSKVLGTCCREKELGTSQDGRHFRRRKPEVGTIPRFLTPGTTVLAFATRIRVCTVESSDK